MQENYIKVAILDHEVEVRLIASILEERDIPHRLRSYHDTAYDGLFQTQKGWGEIWTPERYEEEILAIIADVREAAADPMGV